MYVTNVDTKILSVKDFVENKFETPYEFLLMSCKALASVPIDAYGFFKYTQAHITLARISYLEDRKKSDLIQLGILWDLAKLFSSYSLLKVTRESAFNELISIFKLEQPNQADMTPILAFDANSPDFSDSTLEYLKKVVEYMGLYNLTFSSMYSKIKWYFNE